jgi:hypothetical protein
MGSILHINQALVGASFSPLSISGLQFWVDASNAATITEAAGLVSQWDDLSGNGRHLTQATGANQFTTGAGTINGLNALQTDGNDWMDTAAFSLSQPFTAFAVFTAEADSTAQTHWIGDKTQTNRRFLSFSNLNLINPSFGTTLTGATTMGTGEIHQVTLQVNDASSVLRLNGAVDASGALNTNTLANGMRVGANQAGGTLPTVGTLFAELLLYDSVVSGTDLTNVENYLKNKWGTP